MKTIARFILFGTMLFICQCTVKTESKLYFHYYHLESNQSIAQMPFGNTNYVNEDIGQLRPVEFETDYKKRLLRTTIYMNMSEEFKYAGKYKVKGDSLFLSIVSQRKVNRADFESGYFPKTAFNFSLTVGLGEQFPSKAFFVENNDFF